MSPTVDRLRELLSYEPATGELWWRGSRENGRRLNPRRAGSVRTDGYSAVKIDGKNFYVHRVVWALVTGYWPKLDIDHRDAEPANNRFENLREATDSQNGANTKLAVSNTSGHKGVRFCPSKRRWIAYIWYDGAQHTLGTFQDKETALKVRARAAIERHGEFARVI